MKTKLLCAICLFSVLLIADATDSVGNMPKLSLAEVYQSGVEVSDYWVSEKLDGVRAYWDGTTLRSRQGNIYVTPAWFTADFPRFPLDGELWLGREKFEELLSIVRKQKPDEKKWRQVKYMVFDIPEANGTFSQRLTKLNHIKLADNSRMQVIKQWRVNSHKDLEELLNRLVKQGAEGLMLHHAEAAYRSGRSKDILKFKPHFDAEATVIGYLPGKGKYQHKMGAIVVETTEGKQFKIGTGFTDADRENPPPLGQLITYKYYSKTKRGLPRFASYLRLRNSVVAPEHQQH